jgi:hypothetical protein
MREMEVCAVRPQRALRLACRAGVCAGVLAGVLMVPGPAWADPVAPWWRIPGTTGTGVIGLVNLPLDLLALWLAGRLLGVFPRRPDRRFIAWGLAVWIGGLAADTLAEPTLRLHGYIAMVAATMCLILAWNVLLAVGAARAAWRGVGVAAAIAVLTTPYWVPQASGSAVPLARPLLYDLMALPSLAALAITIVWALCVLTGLCRRGGDRRFWLWGGAVWLANLIAAFLQSVGPSLPGMRFEDRYVSYAVQAALLAFLLNLGLALWIGRAGLRRGVVVAGLVAPLVVLWYVH